MDAKEKIDAAGYKAAEKIETFAETFGDRAQASGERLTDKFGGVTDKFADKMQQVTHQGEYANPNTPSDEEDGERGFMDKVNDVLDNLADKIPTGSADIPRDPGKR